MIESVGAAAQIRDDPTNTYHRFHRAEADEYLGYAFGALAASPKASAAGIMQYRKTARDWFQKSADILEDLRHGGALDPSDGDWAKAIAGEIAKCDAALAK